MADERVAAPAAAEKPPANISDIDAMRNHFKGMKRRKVRIPKESGEQFVQVNGYSFQIQAGVTVEVPEQVAELLEESGII